MAEWTRRRAGLAATAAVGAGAMIVTGVVVVAHDRGVTEPEAAGAAVRPTPDAGSAPTAGPVAPDERRDVPQPWTAQDPSVEAPPAAVVAAAAPHASEDRLLRVVSVVNRDGEPVVVVERARGPQAAAEVVEQRQESDDTVAVSVDTRVRVAAPARRALADPTDPLRGNQWALDRLAAEDTWTDYSTGAGAVVAVVDTGVDGSHPDLAGQLTTAGADYVADGGDGRIDPHGHGTHVAGIVAAVRGNGVGVAGLAPSAQLMPIRVLDATGAGWSSDIAQGIIYAADHGADVVNLSLGGPDEDAPTRTAVNYAVSQGVVVVAAAGNARATDNATNYPAAYPGVLAVASTENGDASSTFSNTGAYVDVAAPGGRILSTVPAGYGYKSGTSMATPYVAATAALVTDLTGGTLTTEQFEEGLTDSAWDLGAAGWDPEFGYGLIDPGRTLCSFTTCDASEAPTSASSPAPVTSTPASPSPSGSTTPASPTASPTTSPSPSGDPSPQTRSVRLVFTTSGGTVRRGRRVPIAVSATDADTGDPLAGQRVVVQGWRQGEIVLRRGLTTDADGDAVVRIRLRRTTRFDLRSPATDTTHAATSPTSIRWRVR